MFYRIRTTDDVVLVKEPNVLYPRFVRYKCILRKAPQSLLARETGVLHPWNKNVKSGKVIVFPNYVAAKNSGEKFEEDVTLTDLFKQVVKKTRNRNRVERREDEDRQYGTIPRGLSWQG